jgi:putative nucleotidyltransferase with HDIG domain
MIISLAISITIPVISPYLILLPAFVMIVSIMLNPRIALLTNIIMTSYISYITVFDNSVLIIMLMTGILGSIMVHKTYHRSTIVYAGLCIGLMSVLLILCYGLPSQMDATKLLIYSIYGLVGGVLSSVLTIGTLPFLETTFDIITPIKLLELSNPSQPLLRRLLIEAPGTYYHSILVGNLSEAAAEEVEANSLLCRIGAYYHDIGKLKRPYFFKENQITKDNPHDKITANLSALIITSHVKDGIEMARKYKLPSSVINIIHQHHGNTLVAYFYHRALNSEGSEQVTEDKFRYLFPKPQTKEAAIVMLADSVEAYIRSLTEPTQEQVEAGVKKIIRDKLQDGQLEQCDLTLKDLDNIARAFVKVLAGIFHDRIEYPETAKDI